MLLGWEDTPIEVIPAVDVLGTGAVRLRQGDYDDVVEQPGDPVALARSFAAAGAGRIHLVDLDGARSGRVRPELVREVAAVVAPARVQASGGIRSPADARSLLAAGAERVVVGTAAFPDPAPWAAELRPARRRARRPRRPHPHRRLDAVRASARRRARPLP